MQNEMSMYEKSPYAVYPNEAMKIAEAAAKQPDMSLQEYVTIYAPQLKQNSCCVRCSNSAACCWANGEPIPGWVALEYDKSDSDEKWAKIYYCPQFRKEDPSRRFVRYKEEGLMALMEALCRDAFREYKHAVETINAETPVLRKAMEQDDSTGAEKSVIRYANAIYAMEYASGGLIGEENAKRMNSSKFGFTPDPALNAFVFREYAKIVK